MKCNNCGKTITYNMPFYDLMYNEGGLKGNAKYAVGLGCLKFCSKACLMLWVSTNGK